MEFFMAPLGLFGAEQGNTQENRKAKLLPHPEQLDSGCPHQSCCEGVQHLTLLARSLPPSPQEEGGWLCPHVPHASQPPLLSNTLVLLCCSTPLSPA